MASEIILAPDWPMQFPCRLGAKRSSGFGMRQSRILGEYERCSQLYTRIQHHLYPLHTTQELFWRKPLGGAEPDHSCNILGCILLLGGSLPQRQPQRGTVEK